MNIYNMEQVSPPVEDNIGVVAISTTASSAINLFGVASITEGARVVNLISNQTFYITFTKDGSDTITAPDETDTTTGARTFGPLAANQIHTFFIGPMKKYCKVKATGSGYLRYYVEK